jgi:hypothetical protein
VAFTLGWFDKTTGTVASDAEIQQEYQTVKLSGTALQTLAQKEAITRLRITDQAIDKLVMDKLAEMETFLLGRQPFAGLGGWPADGQLGLFSMSWALGPAFNFPNFQAAAQATEWLTMARESHMDTTHNSGLIPRNVRNGLLFTIADWWAAPTPTAGDFTQLVYDPGMSLAENMRSPNFPIPLNLEIGVQTALEFLGFDPNGLDGVFSSGTRTALNRFEDDNGLSQTPATATTIADVPTATMDELATQLDNAGITRWP